MKYCVKMDRIRVRVYFNYAAFVFLLVICVGQSSNALNEEYTFHGGSSSPFRTEIVRLPLARNRREASTVEPHADQLANITINSTASSTSMYHTTNSSNGYDTALSPVSVTKTPLLGVNGSGILHVNLTGNMPKVSDPIMPDDNFTDFFKEDRKLAAEHNIYNLTYDDHSFYNSTFIGNVDYFNQFWANITMQRALVHPILSNSHRRATSIRLSFDFPFYGQNIRNITVATGGFIYTGDHVHNWLAATQYIAPLMANFDTSLSNDSVVKLVDEGDNFTAFWENVTLQEDPAKKFTFAVTLFKNGDIVFAYKDIPIEVQDINDSEHPVKVGISDAYFNDKIVVYVRRKTIYEYHRISFKDHMLTNSTILKIVALPTCLQYDTCESCINHNTGFNCTWCPQIRKCSSGTDRNKQDWTLRRCDKSAIQVLNQCPSEPHPDEPTANTTYITDQTTVAHKNATEVKDVHVEYPVNSTLLTQESRSPIGGVVGAFLALAIICSAAAWMLYAFKNPHTRSGQLLIKYRPTQWNWRRGEARYTAATIHM